MEFFECPACDTRYARRPGGPIVFRWRHPISIALYEYFFRSGGNDESYRASAIRALTRERSSEEVAAVVREIEDELHAPTQEVRLILVDEDIDDGNWNRRSEDESRAFLASIVSELKKVKHDA